MNFRFEKPDSHKLQSQGYTAFDMHFHTSHSRDAIARITTALKKARASNFGFAVTDHNTISGARQALQQRIVPVIPGIEVTSAEGIHTLFYFDNYSELEEFYREDIKPSSNPFFIDRPNYDIIQAATGYNCVICCPHPFSAGAPGLMNHEITPSHLGNFAAVELINGYNTHVMNRKAVDYFKNSSLAITGGSDAHTTHELGSVLTYAESSPKEFLETLRKRRTKVVGKEKNIFEKAVLALVKEETYIARAHHESKAMQLIGSQCKTELAYMRERMHLLKTYHSFHPPGF
ncbi:MAG: PHP domain-containing protein [Nanobdellota archaeon]